VDADEILARDLRKPLRPALDLGEHLIVRIDGSPSTILATTKRVFVVRLYDPVVHTYRYDQLTGVVGPFDDYRRHFIALAGPGLETDYQASTARAAENATLIGSNGLAQARQGAAELTIVIEAMHAMARAGPGPQAAAGHHRPIEAVESKPVQGPTATTFVASNRGPTALGWLLTLGWIPWLFIALFGVGGAADLSLPAHALIGTIAIFPGAIDIAATLFGPVAAFGWYYRKRATVHFDPDALWWEGRAGGSGPIRWSDIVAVRHKGDRFEMVDAKERVLSRVPYGLSTLLTPDLQLQYNVPMAVAAWWPDRYTPTDDAADLDARLRSPDEPLTKVVPDVPDGQNLFRYTSLRFAAIVVGGLIRLVYGSH
jgi:hypothetical protein